LITPSLRPRGGQYSPGTRGVSIQSASTASAPDYAYYAQVKARLDGKRAALSEARKLVRQGVHILTDLGDDAFLLE
jgi:hypothetical protein